jgi:predicted AlkP superfamily pyrophosphatase or phosphodiesterase
MKLVQRLRLIGIVVASALLLACAGRPDGVTASMAASPGAAATGKPKLIVFLVVDGLPQRQLLAYRDQLVPDGFNRFLERGAWYANAHYGHSFTVTAAGHATMLTGAYPNRTGIIGNDWRDPATGEPEYCTGDLSATYIGHKTGPLDGTSPKNLKVETVGDVLKRVDARSKVIAISGKDRGAILPAGKTGTAYMYMGATGQFASSTHYMKEHPGWVNAFNAKKPADRYFKTSWMATLPEAAYARSLPDNQPWFGPRGGALPMLMGATADDAPGPAFYTGLLRSPFGDVLSLEFARAAIAGEGLGKDDAPDILAVSLSGHDYINHMYSAESRLSHDHVLHLDRMLQSFFADLDATVGKDNYIAVLTADHGFMPAPEHIATQGQASGRVNTSQVLARVNEGLEKRFGPAGSTPAAKWVTGFSGSTLLMNKKRIAEKGESPGATAGTLASALADEARTLLLAEPSVGAAYTRLELEMGSRAGAPFFEQMRNSWHKDVSGDVQFVFTPNWMVGVAGLVATHGSPHPYDTQVPILLFGPRWIRAGRVDARVEVVDVAPTLSRLLGVPSPSASVGRALP